MDLNELYKEIEKAEVDLNAKRLKYIKEALAENGGSIKLKFKEWREADEYAMNNFKGEELDYYYRITD
jgi:hypothetical protein